MAEYGPLTGTTLGGKYQLGELLGEGGFGAVYKAQNLRLNRPQAVKVIVEKYFRNPQFRERFDREARTLGSLEHPNILHVDDYEIEGDRAYLVMPYISGGTLQTLLKQQGKLSLEKTGTYLRQISDALDYAHARGVVHLDLKPLNLLYQNGILFLSDFGLAHLLREGGVEEGTSLRFGTPHYMAPEHFHGTPHRASDIYALGVMLYQMLTAQRPFEGRTPEAILAQHLQATPPSLRSTRPDIPGAIDTVIQKAMAKKPVDRYASAGALFNDFRSKAVLALPPLAVVQQPQPQAHQPSQPTVMQAKPPLPPTEDAYPNTHDTPAYPNTGASEAMLPALTASLAQHSEIKLDTPPSLEMINHILQEIGKRVGAGKEN